MHQYLTVPISMYQYLPVCISTYQYVSVPIRALTHPTVGKTGLNYGENYHTCDTYVRYVLEGERERGRRRGEKREREREVGERE